MVISAESVTYTSTTTRAARRSFLLALIAATASRSAFELVEGRCERLSAVR
jgi:hypothetical protein